MQLTFYKKRELGGTAVFEFRASHDSGPLSGSGSSWERGWRKVAHGDIVSELCDSTVGSSAPLGCWFGCEDAHRNVVRDVIDFIFPDLHPPECIAGVPGITHKWSGRRFGGEFAFPRKWFRRAGLRIDRG